MDNIHPALSGYFNHAVYTLYPLRDDNVAMMAKRKPCEADPDLFSPEMPIGRPHISAIKKVAEQIVWAIEICETCPFRSPCGEEGMKEENLTFGIWGGKMAGERLVEKGHQMHDFPQESDERKAIEFTIRMTPLVRWQSAEL